VWVSASWTRVLGWSFEELISRPFVEFVHPDDIEPTAHKSAAMFDEGDNAISFENRYRTKAGEYRWLQWNAFVAPNDMVLASARDITARKLERIRELERIRLLEMSEQLVGVAHWRVDLVADQLYWSQGVFRIFGIPESAGSPTLEQAIAAYHPDDRERVERLLSRTVERAESFAFEARVVRPSGELRAIEAQGRPERDADGKVIAVYGILRDITDSQQLEEILRRSERMISIGTMAAGVAHELNNPLSYLIGNLELVHEEIERLRPTLPPATAADLDEMLDDALSGTMRVRRIVDGMRSFSRIGTAKTSDVDVHAAIGAAVAIAEHEVRMRARLELELEPCGAVHIDETQLVQVLVNLIVNAAQALPEGQAGDHEIRVEARQLGDEVELRVKDTGPGISPEVRGRIFDPFFTTKPVGSGTGLGLSICHSIVTSHGGSIELEHTQVGASFRLLFPAVVRRREPSVAINLSGAPELDSEPSTRRRLLLIDDETQLLTMLHRALERQFEVVQAHSGQDALDILARDVNFDLLLCDLMMPEVSGVELFETLCERHPQLVTRIVFATGGTVAKDFRELAEDNGVEILRKPFDITELRARLRERFA